eukprot:TRINITY_DN4670_c0_g1_i2.p1 TRINITY_DN4670_c0_g1~~TRINITY_DN4670_c0_g1_i2.p1  ORF type:complete len:938 (+),score=184.29 TRINITY_DN4670_c0_g1_i2:108-2816(+)
MGNQNSHVFTQNPFCVGNGYWAGKPRACSPTGAVDRDRRRCCTPPNRPPVVGDKTQIEFITDIEGNWNYLLEFIESSKVLYWRGPTRGPWGPGQLEIRPDCVLVFGGDAVDKGPGDIRICKTLLSLKWRYPTQVFLILGNRDLMKLRMAAELAPGQENNIWLPTWDKKPTEYETYLGRVGHDRSLVTKLQWMLQCNMGCQDTTFNTRKEELALLSGGEVSDEDVLSSYLTSVDPNADDCWMLDFLLAGVLAVVVGDALFVHGGLNKDSVGAVPQKADAYDSVHEWVAELNAWKNEEMEMYLKHPQWIPGSNPPRRGGWRLIEYGTPGAGTKTVIYHNPFVNGNPVRRDQEVVDFLRNNNIKRMFSGHQPHGQTPTVVRHPDTGLLVVTCDTSRSDANAMKLLNPADNRGHVVSVVWMQGPYTHIQGYTKDGQKHSCRVHTDPNQDDLPNWLVGRQLSDGSWVKTVLANGSSEVVAALGSGFNVSVQTMSMEQACMRLKDEYGYKGQSSILRHVQESWLRERVRTIEDCSDVYGDAWLDPTSPASRFNFDSEAFKSLDTYIFALQGTIPDESSDNGRTAEKINKLIEADKRIVIVTNNSNLSQTMLLDRMMYEKGVNLLQTSLSRRLSDEAGMGEVKTPMGTVKKTVGKLSCVSSSVTCAWLLERRGSKKPFVICSSKGLLDELEAKGITDYVATCDREGRTLPQYLEKVTEGNIFQSVAKIIAQAPDIDAIVVGWDHELTALKIAVAAQYMRWGEELRMAGKGEGIPIISCSMDNSSFMGTAPLEAYPELFRGRKMRGVGNGTMANAICQCVNDDVRPIDAGKPSMLLLEYLRRPLEEGGCGIDFSRAVMIGDSLNTDVELANKAGMKSLLVLSGVSSQEDLHHETDPLRQPTWVVSSFANT